MRPYVPALALRLTQSPLLARPELEHALLRAESSYAVSGACLGRLGWLKELPRRRAV
jgi:hypothetical protein